MPDEEVERINRLSAEIHELSERGEYARAIPMASHLRDLVRSLVGENDPAYAAVLDQQAKLYLDTADYSTAETLLRTALEVTRSTLGNDHPKVASRLNGLALVNKSVGNYAEAAKLYDEAVGWYRAHPDRRELGRELSTTLRNLAELKAGLGDLTTARELLREALTAAEEAPGDARRETALVLNSIGRLAKTSGHSREAARYLRRALQAGRAAFGDTHRHIALISHDLAGVYQERGHYRTAERLYERALQIDRQLVGEEHPDFAADLDGLARLYLERHDYAAAEPKAVQALAIVRATFGEFHPIAASSLNTLAEIYRETGRLAEAEPLYRRALDVRRQILGARHPDVAQSLHNWALLRNLMGDFAAVRSLEEEALSIVLTALPQDHPLTANVLSNLAAAYEAFGEYEKAESLLLQSLSIRRKAYGGSHVDVGHSLNNLGALYRLVRDPERAESYLRQALDVYRGALGEQSLLVSYCLNNLGGLHVEMGRVAEAQELLTQALGIRRAAVGNDHPLVANSLLNLSIAHAISGDMAAALALALEGASIHDRLIGQVFSIASERQRIEYARMADDALQLVLSIVRQRFLNDPPVVCSAFDLVLRRKGLGAEALSEQRDAVLGGRSPELRARLKELAALREKIAERTLAGPGGSALADHQRVLATWETQREELEAGLARRIPEMSLERRLRQASRSAVARALPEGAALVEIVRLIDLDFTTAPGTGRPLGGRERYVAFLMRAGAPEDVRMFDLGSALMIDTLVRDYREAVAPEHGASTDPEDEPVLGAELRQTVFDPLQDALGDCKQVLVSPDGELYRLPLEILPTAEGCRLLDDLHISYLGTGRDILRVHETATRASRRSLVVADPDFDLRARGTPSPAEGAPAAAPFNPLPGTRAEGEAVAALLGVKARVRGRALESAVKARRAPRVLHIATHGFFLPDSPRDSGLSVLGALNGKGVGEGGFHLGRLSASKLENPLLRSGLALAGANRWMTGAPLPASAEDGLLTAEDVTGLDLLGTEIVVLSACDTGLGDVQRGEGVFGLRRAFVLAGARTLVMSLWKVPDDATRELMEELYKHLLRGVARADALRAAQISLRARYPEPFYWGAFILQGDPGPLRGTAAR